jgi:hypothetical protein
MRKTFDVIAVDDVSSEFSGEDVKDLIYLAQDEAIVSFQGLFEKTEIRKSTMTLEEVENLDKKIRFGTIHHYEYLLRMIRLADEQAVVDCMAAGDLKNIAEKGDLTLAGPEQLSDEEIRDMVEASLSEYRLRIVESARINTSQQITFTAEVHQQQQEAKHAAAGKKTSRAGRKKPSADKQKKAKVTKKKQVK